LYLLVNPPHPNTTGTRVQMKEDKIYWARSIKVHCEDVDE